MVRVKKGKKGNIVILQSQQPALIITNLLYSPSLAKLLESHFSSILDHLIILKRNKNYILAKLKLPIVIREYYSDYYDRMLTIEPNGNIKEKLIEVERETLLDKFRKYFESLPKYGFSAINALYLLAQLGIGIDKYKIKVEKEFVDEDVFTVEIKVYIYTENNEKVAELKFYDDRLAEEQGDKKPLETIKQFLEENRNVTSLTGFTNSNKEWMEIVEKVYDKFWHEHYFEKIMELDKSYWKEECSYGMEIETIGGEIDIPPTCRKVLTRKAQIKIIESLAFIFSP